MKWIVVLIAAVNLFCGQSFGATCSSECYSSESKFLHEISKRSDLVIIIQKRIPNLSDGTSTTDVIEGILILSFIVGTAQKTNDFHR